MSILKRMTAARSAAVTCSASRHAAEVGERLVRYGSCQMIADPAGAHEAGESIAATVAALWEARAEIERLRQDAARYRWRRERLEHRRHGELADAAFAWWESRRPVEFGIDDHICHPMVNCSGEPERALARAVVAVLDYRRQAKDGRLE